MQISRLVPAGMPAERRRSWTIAASVVLHLAAFAALLSMTARRPPLDQGGGAPSYDLVFEGPETGPSQSGMPPTQQADLPTPEDALPGPPAPSPTSQPDPDGVPSDLPESAASVPPPLLAPDTPHPEMATPPAPVATQAPPPPSAEVPVETARPAPAPVPNTAPPALAFAPEAAPAELPPPPPVEVVPTPTAPPAVRLDTPVAPDRPQQQAMIMPRPPPPLPPTPPRPRPAPRPAPGTFANPMDLSFGPSAPRPAPGGRRTAVASRAIDLSIGPPRQGPARSDPYAEIRAANASADWNRGLLTYWLRHRYYPQQAAENGEDGVVEIELTVNKYGRVESVDLKSRSGSQWLDMAAVGTFRNGQLPPFTPEMREDRITFTIPIHYVLMRR